MLQSKFTYYVIILGGVGGQGHDYLDYAGGWGGGAELGKTWSRNICTLPN